MSGDYLIIMMLSNKESIIQVTDMGGIWVPANFATKYDLPVTQHDGLPAKDDPIPSVVNPKADIPNPDKVIYHSRLGNIQAEIEIPFLVDRFVRTLNDAIKPFVGNSVSQLRKVVAQSGSML